MQRVHPVHIVGSLCRLNNSRGDRFPSPCVYLRTRAHSFHRGTSAGKLFLRILRFETDIRSQFDQWMPFENKICSVVNFHFARGTNSENMLNFMFKRCAFPNSLLEIFDFAESSFLH